MLARERDKCFELSDWLPATAAGEGDHHNIERTAPAQSGLYTL